MICLLALEDAIMTFYPQQISRSNTSPKYLHWFYIIRKRYLASFVITATPLYATSAQRLQCLCNKLSTSLHSRLIYVEEFFNRFLGLQGTLPDVMPLVLKLVRAIEHSLEGQRCRRPQWEPYPRFLFQFFNYLMIFSTLYLVVICIW